MARVNGYFSFRVCHKTESASVIRGHHVCMSVWSAAVGEKLFAAPDPRDEAREYDKFAVGLYKEENDQKLLVGHVPIEISSLCYHFLKKSKTNTLNAVITGKRQREVELGLVVPVKYSFETDDKKCAEILEKELVKRKELFPTVVLKFKKKGLYRKFPMYNE